VDDPASSVVKRMREWLGGEGALDRVRTIELTRATGTTQIRLPDHYRNDIYAPFGVMTVLFDGVTVRHGRPASLFGPDQRQGTVDVDRWRRRVALDVLKYLVRTVPTYKFKAIMSTSGCAGLAGNCVSFVHGDAPPVEMLAASSDGRPVAFIAPFATTATGPVVAYNVSDLADYRRVGGIRVPFMIVERRVDNKTNKSITLTTWKYSSVRINVEMPDETFAAP
jgi:hypothetical protein